MTKNSSNELSLGLSKINNNCPYGLKQKRSPIHTGDLFSSIWLNCLSGYFFSQQYNHIIFYFHYSAIHDHGLLSFRSGKGNSSLCQSRNKRSVIIQHLKSSMTQALHPRTIIIHVGFLVRRQAGMEPLQNKL